MPKRNGSGIALLADPTRRRLVALLAIRPRRPSSLAAEIGLSRPATARQLHLLEEAGLIRASRFLSDRRAVLFAIDPRMHGPITAWLAGTEIARRVNLLADNAERPTSPPVDEADHLQPRDAHLPAGDAHLPPSDAHLPAGDAHLPPSDAHLPAGDARLQPSDAD